MSALLAALRPHYFLWTYGRVLAWIALLTLVLHRALGRPKVTKAFLAAHLLAAAAGALTDAFLIYFAPKTWLTIDVLQWVYVAPIAVFTVISLWIGNWETPVTVPDVLMTLLPIALWGLLVVFGWQDMYSCHVLGAWLVAAACGGVDLYTRYGPAWTRKRSHALRLAGYVALVAAVYLVLPRFD